MAHEAHHDDETLRLMDENVRLKDKLELCEAGRRVADEQAERYRDALRAIAKLAREAVGE